MNQSFMIDLETTGLNQQTDDIIQFGLLEVKMDDKWGIYFPGNTFSMFLPTSKSPRPDDKFANEHMTEMYKYCNGLGAVDLEAFRSQLSTYFTVCNAQLGKVKLMGKNLSMFDVPFCLAKGLLQKNDYHYRLYEITGSINLLMDSLMLDQDKDRYAFLDWAYEIGTDVAIEAQLEVPHFEALNRNLSDGRPKYKEHESIFDCYRQLHETNGLLVISRWGAAQQSEEFPRFLEIKAVLDAKKASKS